MSLGSWDPSIEASDTALQLQPDLLRRFIESDRGDQLEDLPQLLSEEEKQLYA